MGRIFSLCAENGLSLGGTKMKFRWKLVIVTMLIVSFSFGFGGMLLIQNSYHATLKQEKRVARNSYETILRMLKKIDEMDDTYQNQTFASVLKRLSNQGLLGDTSVRLLKEKDGVAQWNQPVYYNRKNDDFKKGGHFTTRQGEEVIFQRKNRIYYQITSRISYGKEKLVFQGAYDISEVYQTRHKQLVSFRKIFAVVLGIGILLSYFLASILTKPLQRLSQVSKQIADGDYSVRVPVHTEDEIGELSINFNYMTEQLVEKLMKLDQLLKNQEFQMQNQDLEPMIRAVAAFMQYRLEEQKVLLNLNLKSVVCKIEPDLLKSLILNLMDNALKSMDEGGILSIENKVSEEGTKIYISDNGCGMPKEEISKITEAFYRVDKSRSRKQGGVGLGLALCKEIVRIHHGDMEFISQPGKGTTVMITIGGCDEKTN